MREGLVASGGPSYRGLPPELEASWRRSRAHSLDAESTDAPLFYDGLKLDDYRRNHPLAALLPMVRSVLTDSVAESGLIVAVVDYAGTLLWVEGDHHTRTLAEDLSFGPGANWAEQSMGTSAPAVALVTGRPVQVARTQHFALHIQCFSCTAVPVRDPITGKILGALDITGGDRAVAGHALALMKATGLACEGYLRELYADRMPTCLYHGGVQAGLGPTTLSAVGRAKPLLVDGAGNAVELSQRHAEILFLLCWEAHQRGRGMSAEELSEQLFGSGEHVVTVRAEMTRLRKFLAARPALAVEVESRPYRLVASLELDVVELWNALRSGDLDQALGFGSQSFLPESGAPGVFEVRHRVATWLREPVLERANAEQVLKYPDTCHDEEDEQVMMLALKILPEQHPRRTEIVLNLERTGEIDGMRCNPPATGM